MSLFYRKANFKSFFCEGECNLGYLYVEPEKEAHYVESLYHIGVSFSPSTKRMLISLNNNVIAKTIHTGSGDFLFGSSDTFIGSNGSNTKQASGTAVSNNQFMGEIHELCVEKLFRDRYPATNTLMPVFDETAMYLRFDEVDV